MRVAIIGAGVAGSFLAYLLAQRQIPAVVFERKRVREKACGGGCTPKVAHAYPSLLSNNVRKNLIQKIYYQSRHHDRVLLELSETIWIYSRRELDGYLLDQAVQLGTRLIHSRVRSYELDAKGKWMIEAENGENQKVDLLIGADGATSPTRKRFGIHFTSEDFSITVGYYIPGQFHPDSIYIRFFEPDLLGYLWSFPRVDHISLGIINAYRRLSASDLRSKLGEFASDLYGFTDLKRFSNYAAPVPTLREETLRNLKVNGANWALIGDAAGFVDPITAEGIYYAMRSAELLADAIEKDDMESYHRRWREDFGFDLAEAAGLKKRFYQKNLLCDTFISRMLQLTRRSRTIQKAHNDLIAGRENYLSLKRKLIQRLPKVIWEVVRPPAGQPGA